MPGARAVSLAGPAAAVGVTVMSALAAICAGLISRFAWRPGGVVVPWGMLLCIGAAVSVVAVARTAGRGHGFLAVAGWMGGLIVILVGRPEGDFIIASDFLGWAFLIAPTTALIVAAGWSTKPPGGRPAQSSDPENPAASTAPSTTRSSGGDAR